MNRLLVLLVASLGLTSAQGTLPAAINDVFVDTDTIVFACDSDAGAADFVTAVTESLGEEIEAQCGRANASFDDWLAIYNRTVEFDLAGSVRVAWHFSVPIENVSLFSGGFAFEQVFYRFWVFEFSGGLDLLIVTDAVALEIEIETP